LPPIANLAGYAGALKIPNGKGPNAKDAPITNGKWDFRAWTFLGFGGLAFGI
jgi:hypothetical protein